MQWAWHLLYTYLNLVLPDYDAVCGRKKGVQQASAAKIQFESNSKSVIYIPSKRNKEDCCRSLFLLLLKKVIQYE
jgi:hypothetical protein